MSVLFLFYFNEMKIIVLELKVIFVENYSRCFKGGSGGEGEKLSYSNIIGITILRFMQDC